MVNIRLSILAARLTLSVRLRETIAELLELSLIVAFATVLSDEVAANATLRLLTSPQQNITIHSFFISFISFDA
jgi:hypothetical protein